MLILIIYFCFIQCAYSKPLQGHVTNRDLIPKQALVKQTPNIDKRGKPLTGKLVQTRLRGLIGIRYDIATGQITYMYPECDLNRYNIKTGDYILKIEREAFRPCLMPNVVIYPKGYILNLTIRGKGGSIRTVPIKLIDAKNIIGGS